MCKSIKIHIILTPGNSDLYEKYLRPIVKVKRKRSITYLKVSSYLFSRFEVILPLGELPGVGFIKLLELGSLVFHQHLPLFILKMLKFLDGCRAVCLGFLQLFGVFHFKPEKREYVRISRLGSNTILTFAALHGISSSPPLGTF